MVPAILILTFAWTLKTMTESLGAKEFVAGLVGAYQDHSLDCSRQSYSWWELPCFCNRNLMGHLRHTHTDSSKHLLRHKPYDDDHLNLSMYAGAVCGDHCSPISDTTIMASAGAQCNHMNHVSTQLPYAVLVAAVSCLTYIIAGFVRNPIVPFIIGVLILIGTFVGIKYITRTDKANEQA